MDYISQLLQVATIFSVLLVYWQVKELAPKKRKYRHTKSYLLKKAK